MQSIKILMDEHQVILKVLAKVPSFLVKFSENPRQYREQVYNLIHFVQVFADEHHHKKEEDVLFLWMKEKGFPYESGPIACMLSEHNTGRHYIQLALDNLSKDLEKDETAVSMVSQSLQQFAIHLREHISKEDNVLYPMALRLFQDDTDKDLMARYAKKISPDKSEEITKSHADWAEAFAAQF